MLPHGVERGDFMQPLNYSLLNKRVVVRTTKGTENKEKSCFIDENRHKKLFADSEVNEYVNAQIEKASRKLDDVK